MIKNTKFYFISNISSLFIALFSLPIFTRFLSPSDFAILALFVLFGTLTAQITSFALSEASRKFFFDEINFIKLNSTNFLFVLTVFIIFSFVIFLLSELISKYIFANKISNKLIVISYFYGCIMWSFQYLNTLFVIQEKSYNYFLVNLITNIASPILSIIILLQTNLTYEARIISIIFIFSLSCLVSFYLNKYLFKFIFDYKSLKKSFVFAMPLVPNTIISQVHEATDKTMTNYFLGLNSLGILSIAIRIADISKLVINSFLQAWDPYFLKNSSENLLNKKRILSGFYSILSVIFLSCYSLSLFSEEIVKILTVEDYFFTIQYIPIICFSIFLVHIFSSLSVNQLIKTEKTGSFFKISTITMLMNLLLNLILIPKYQIFGAIFATMISGSFGGIYSFYLGQKSFKIDIKLTTILCFISIYFFFNIPIYILLNYELNIVIKLIIKFFLFFSVILILKKLKFIRNSLIYNLKILIKKKLFNE